MFGIDSLDQVGQIAEGWTNRVLNREQELVNKRLPICLKCPLHTDTIGGGKCDRNKWYNPETKDLSTEYHPGYISACGCPHEAALRVASKKCPLDKW